MVFVDTGAWFASAVPWDGDHTAASQWMRQNQELLVTTDFVVDETLTLLRVRNENARALILGEQLLASRADLRLYLLDEADLRRAWEVFKAFSDKEWSFTDCTSKLVMEKLGITRAFAFDQHFRQFGTVTVVP